MSDERPWRCFVAVPIGEQLRQDLALAVAGWRAEVGHDDLRWSEPDGWHVTLAFLGGTDAARVPDLAERLGEVVSGQDAFALTTGRLGAFPSPSTARVVWFGVDDEQRRLASLAIDVRRAVGVPTDAPFRAHVTLARARRRPVSVRGWLESAAAPSGQVQVGAVHLYRSHLGKGPARYELLAAMPLAAGRLTGSRSHG